MTIQMFVGEGRGGKKLPCVSVGYEFYPVNPIYVGFWFSHFIHENVGVCKYSDTSHRP